MYLLRVQELRTNARASRAPGGFIEGLRYVWARPDLRSILVMLFLIGTFGLNFPIFISTMAVNVFHADVRGFGLLSSIMAIGTMTGAFCRLDAISQSLGRCSSAPESSGSVVRLPRSLLDTGGSLRPSR
jgi:hypothetical protein